MQRSQLSHDPKHCSVGLIGLGIIGSRVAANLRREGIPLFVWNRSPKVEPNFLSSPLEVAESADIIQIFVKDGVALLEVLRQMSPSLTAKHIILNHATVAPQETLEAADIVTKRGAQFLDAPFTGSRDAAAEGKLIYYIGGSSELLKKVEPILKISSQERLMMGDIGAATYVKIATNLIAGVQVEALAEALELVSLGGVPLHRLMEALRYNVGNSTLIKMKAPQMIKADFEPRFTAKNMLKDLQIMLQEAGLHNVSLPAAEAAAGALKETLDQGWGDADYSVVAARYDYPGKNNDLLHEEDEFQLAADLEKKKSESSAKKSFLSRLCFWKKEEDVQRWKR